VIVTGIQSVLDPRSPQAAEIFRLLTLMFWISAVVYVVVMLFLAAAVWRGRRREEPDHSDERRLVAVVGTGAGLTVVTLLVILTASVAAGRAAGTSPVPAAFEIDVIGHQWWWEVQYPDTDPSKSFKTANEIHIPVGTPVDIHLTTRDVIHSLWIPNLNGKRDLIPGRENRLRIEATSPGVFRSQCAEFCGLQHANMALVVTAEDPAAFARWKARQQAPAVPATTAAQLHGRQIFLSMPCVKCHAITGEETYATVGPDLTHVASRPTLAAGTLMNTRGNLAGWIVNAPALKPGTQMPPNQIGANDLQDLIAFLENLK
jgi:cytochrome c oxidase subunit 2